MPGYKDLFSAGAANYAAHRPSYPEGLTRWVSELAPSRDCAWDCATGNGQAAQALAHYFQQVVATDASEAQLRQATPAKGVSYAVMTAESAALRHGSVDLITVAQALHWIDMSRFCTEADRVLVPGGVLAAWSYALPSVDPVIDAEIMRFNTDVVGPYWTPERRLVETGYAAIELPFEEIDVPAFAMEAWWTLDQLVAYVSTWSSVSRFCEARGWSPVGQFRASLGELWGGADTERKVTWPLTIRASRKR